MSDLKQHVDEKMILHTARIGLWRVEFDRNGVTRFYADAMMDELLGITEPVTPEERQEFFAERIHPDDRELFQEYMSKLTEVRTEIVYRYIHPFSGEMMVRCGGCRDMSVTDRISIIGTHQDISDMLRLEKNKIAERRLAEQNLILRKEQVSQENYYRDLLDVQNCGLLAYTLPGHKVIHMNKEALRMYDVKDVKEAQQKLGIILKGVYYPEKETMEKLKDLRNTDAVVDYECIINKDTEKECHAVAKTKSIYLPSGERAVVTTFLDVSDMMMLRKALQQAQAGSKAKSDFLFAMSHDLRTPMNAIIGYADLMESHWGEETISKEYLSKLKEASRFLLALIGNILEVSRIESGKETLNETVWDVRKLNGTLDILMESEITRKCLNVTRNIHVTHQNVLCDTMKLREILMNLMSNAVKYTPAYGSINVNIEELPAAEPNRMILKMTVSDSGIGINKEYIPHLFEAFSRERNSSESGIMGTGLGLRIVKSFADLMNGTITVESIQGKGSCFTVEIPLKLALAKSMEQDNKQKTEISLKGKRILLAEDNALNAEITSTILSDAGVYVEIAENGKIAVEMLKAASAGYYDLIIMDIQMPVMNGYQAARAIRTLPDFRSQIPIIAMTANAFEEDRRAAFKAGMNGYAAKPIEIEKLMRIIAETLDKPDSSNFIDMKNTRNKG